MATMNVSLPKQNQLDAIDSYRFEMRAPNMSAAAREIMRAGLVALAADGTNPKRQAAAVKALDLWDKEPSE